MTNLMHSLIFSCYGGSHMYGTSTPESDIDIRGVFIPNKDFVYGLDNISQITIPEEQDCVYYELRKFLKLALDCNPNIIELFFVKPENWLTKSGVWETIVEHREYFITTKARYTFSGYATSQLHRIKSHRKWLLNPPVEPPKRKDFGLPEDRSLVTSSTMGAFNSLLAFYLTEIHRIHPLKDQIEELMENKDYMALVQKIQPINPDFVADILPLESNVLEIYQREQAYAREKKKWDDFLIWKKTRNPARAKLESKYGYDTKHASHLWRLIQEGKDLLISKHITFPLPYAEEILEIRNGKYSYDELMEKIGDIDEQFNNYLNLSSSYLPKKPDRDLINKLCIRLMEQILVL